MSKYHSRKVSYDGKVFDSKKEAKRYAELKQLERAGIITNLETQGKFVLIPAQYETVERISLKTGKPLKPKKKLVEREVAYFADFVYMRDGNQIVEDTKSTATRTKDYIIKRKLLLWVHGIKVQEI